MLIVVLLLLSQSSSLFFPSLRSPTETPKPTHPPLPTMTEDEELESSALKIQKIARGRKARRGNRRFSSPKKALASEEDMAAAKLQSLQRGKKSRKQVEEMREQKAAAGRIQAIHRGRADRRVVLAKKEGGLELEVKDVRKVRRRDGGKATGGEAILMRSTDDRCYVTFPLSPHPTPTPPPGPLPNGKKPIHP